MSDLKPLRNDIQVVLEVGPMLPSYGQRVIESDRVAAMAPLYEALLTVRATCSTLGMDKSSWDEVDAALAWAEQNCPALKTKEEAK